MNIRDDWKDKSSICIGLGTDHGGYEEKNLVKEELTKAGYQVKDFGPFEYNADDDYCEYAVAVAKAVQMGEIDAGILFCKSGIGMSITANRLHGVRAALCNKATSAVMSRQHNNSNLLVIGANTLSHEEIFSMIQEWLATPFTKEERHCRRLRKLENITLDEDFAIRERDPEIAAIIGRERARQNRGIELIASENVVTPAVRAAAGSILTNKYAEGYPAHRYYNGCAHVDEIESLAIERACQLFGAEAANVQPHSGSQANAAAYTALIQPGDTVLAMRLDMGGHLSHGHGVNFSGRTYNFIGYGVRQDTETIDYDEVERLALENHPKLILAGASAYPRIIDFKRFREIADKVGAYFMVDMAHIAGLVATGEHPSPVPYCDIVTTTTHKTLRGPRGGLILCKKELLKKVNSAVFPGLQGGPLMHIVAAKAVCFKEAMTPEFKAYQHQIRLNAAVLANELQRHGFRIVSGGTDNHVMLVDLRPKNISGKDAANALDLADITANMNMIPFDPAKPTVTSGVRIGTPAVTTRGMKEPEMVQIAEMIKRIVEAPTDEAVIADVRNQVHALTARFPMPDLLKP